MNLDLNTRYEIMENLAKKWTDKAEMSEIVSYYFNAQFEYLNDLPENELLSLADKEGFKYD